MGRTRVAVVRMVGKGKRWLLPRGSFHSVGKVSFLRGSQSNTTRALHTRSPRETEERRHSPYIPRAHSLERERPVSSILATACPTLDRGKSWGEIDTPALSCAPAWPQSILLQPFLSELPLRTPPNPPGLQLWPGLAALLGGWFAIRAAPIGPPSLPHQEPWELGRHSSAGSDMNLLLRAPGDQS